MNNSSTYLKNGTYYCFSIFLSPALHTEDSGRGMALRVGSARREMIKLKYEMKNLLVYLLQALGPASVHETN